MGLDWGNIINFRSPLLYLGIMYLFMASLALLQAIRIIYYRHRLISYHMGFLVLCFLLGTIRGFFFVFTSKFPPIVELAIYWVPFVMEFAAFTLFVLFYAKHMYKERWARLSWRMWIAYFGFNFVFILFLIAFFIMEAFMGSYDNGTNNSPLWLTNMAQGFSGVLFFILSVFLGYYGFRVAKMVKDGEIATPFLLKGASKHIVLIATGLIVVSFITRSAYDFFTIFFGSFGVLQDDITSNWIVIILYLWWEIIPALVLILLFWNVSGKSHRDVIKRKDAVPRQQQLPYQLINQDEPGSMFSNDLRYETDGDDYFSLASPTPPLFGHTRYSTTPVTTNPALS